MLTTEPAVAAVTARRIAAGAGVGEVAGVDVVRQHRGVTGGAREPQDLGRGVLGGRGPEERAGAAGEGGDPVAAALDLRPHRGRRHPRERRVAPGVVAQLVAVVGDELRGVRVLREPRADASTVTAGAPVGQRGEDAAGEAEVACAVEGQARPRGARRWRARARARGRPRQPPESAQVGRSRPSGRRAARRRLRRGRGPRNARHGGHAAGRRPTDGRRRAPPRGSPCATGA